MWVGANAAPHPLGEVAELAVVTVDAYAPGPPRRAYDLATDMESYPRFMKDLISVEVLERNGRSQLTAWSGRLQGRVLRWKEKDDFDDSDCVIRYRQIEGDLRRFEGAWSFVAEGDGTRITLRVEYEVGIPMLAGLLDPVAGVVIRRNCRDMLDAMRQRLEQDQTGAPT